MRNTTKHILIAGSILIVLVGVLLLIHRSHVQYTLIEQKRIDDTTSNVKFILSRKEVNNLNQHLYQEVLEPLKTTTVRSLKSPTIASAKISLYQPPEAEKESLLIQLAWIESKPTIEGFRMIDLDGNIDVPVQINNHVTEDSQVLFFVYHQILSDDQKWDQWKAIYEKTKLNPVNVVLTKDKLTVSKEFPLQAVAPLLVLKTLKEKANE